MELTYYADTDTLAIVLADGPAARTETLMVTIEHPGNIPGYDPSVIVRMPQGPLS